MIRTTGFYSLPPSLPRSHPSSPTPCDTRSDRDIAPVAPTHILIIPKLRNGLTQLRHATADHAGILGYMLEVAAKLAKEEGLEGFRYNSSRTNLNLGYCCYPGS